jgi:hypothetical protein
MPYVFEYASSLIPEEEIKEESSRSMCAGTNGRYDYYSTADDTSLDSQFLLLDATELHEMLSDQVADQDKFYGINEAASR